MSENEKPRKKRRAYKIKPLSEKRKAVELFRKGEIPVAEIAKQFDVSPGTITQQWVKQVDRGVDRLLGGYKRPTDKFKLKVVREVLSGSLTIEQAAERYDIVASKSIKQWIEKFSSDSVIALEIPQSSMSSNSKKRGRPKKQPDDQQALEEALEEARLKIVALETMITIAEEQFKIDIRKKSGTKQSK